VIYSDLHSPFIRCSFVDLFIWLFGYLIIHSGWCPDGGRWSTFLLIPPPLDFRCDSNVTLRFIIHTVPVGWFTLVCDSSNIPSIPSVPLYIPFRASYSIDKFCNLDSPIPLLDIPHCGLGWILPIPTRFDSIPLLPWLLWFWLHVLDCLSLSPWEYLPVLSDSSVVPDSLHWRTILQDLTIVFELSVIWYLFHWHFITIHRIYLDFGFHSIPFHYLIRFHTPFMGWWFWFFHSLWWISGLHWVNRFPHCWFQSSWVLVWFPGLFTFPHSHCPIPLVQLPSLWV